MINGQIGLSRQAGSASKEWTLLRVLGPLPVEVRDGLVGRNDGKEPFFTERWRGQDGAPGPATPRVLVDVEADRHAHQRQSGAVERAGRTRQHDVTLVEQLREHAFEEKVPGLLHFHVGIGALEHAVEKPRKSIREVPHVLPETAATAMINGQIGLSRQAGSPYSGSWGRCRWKSVTAW